MPILHKKPKPSTNSAHISLSVIDAFLRKVHAGFDTMTSVEQGIWREILTQINSATVKGLMQSSATSHSEAFLSALRHSNEVFAAFNPASTTTPARTVTPFPTTTPTSPSPVASARSTRAQKTGWLRYSKTRRSTATSAAR